MFVLNYNVRYRESNLVYLPVLLFHLLLRSSMFVDWLGLVVAACLLV